MERLIWFLTNSNSPNIHNYISLYLACFQEVAGLVAVQTNGLQVAFKALLTQSQDGLRGIGHWKKLARGLVHAHIGGLG